MKKLALLLAAAMLLSLFGCKASDNSYNSSPEHPTLTPSPVSDFEYEVNKDLEFVVINGYLGTNTDVVVPSEIEGYPVKGVYLPENATIETIVLPDTMESIFMNAFMNCPNLRSVVLGKNVTSIGEMAFRYCVNLKSINFPSSLKTIGNEAFMHCKSLETAILPSGLETIDSQAFAFCSSLKEVYIPKTVKFKGTNNFLGAESLTTLTFEEGTVKIGSYAAFSGATSLSQVTIPASVTEICDASFSACPALRTVVFLGNAPSKVGHIVFGVPSKDVQVIYNQTTIGWNSTPLSDYTLVSQ